MFDFTLTEKLLLPAALIAGAALAVLAVVAAVDYLVNDPKEPFTRTSGLEPAQQRAVDTKNQAPIPAHQRASDKVSR